MKHEWRKAEKQFYLPKPSPVLIHIPKQRFFVIQGKGSSASEEFSKQKEILLLLSHAIRLMPQNGFYPPGYYEFALYPFEAVWSLGESVGKPSERLYKLMIRQPDFADNDTVLKAFEIASRSKRNDLLNEVMFEEIEEGMAVQILHTGPYNNEKDTFEKMHRFLEENDCRRRSQKHREIYLNDLPKTAPAKLKTVLRFQVEEIMS